VLLLRLAETAPGKRARAVRSGGEKRAAEAALELVLPTGERLRIGPGVDITTLRTVLDVLRG
jgi:hypothetical protein